MRHLEKVGILLRRQIGRDTLMDRGNTDAILLQEIPIEQLRHGVDRELGYLFGGGTLLGPGALRD